MVKTTAPVTRTGVVVVMRGTVGAGKSTYSEMIREQVVRAGGYCVVEGTDKYCKTGKTPIQAVAIAGRSLRAALDVNNPLKVVVIDTCGERDSGSTYFGVNFATWRKVVCWPNFVVREGKTAPDCVDIQGYLAWTLRNVLGRGDVTADANYYLSPKGAGAAVCVTVHTKKASALFRGVAIPTVVDDAAANRYAALLAEKMPLEATVRAFVETHLLARGQ